MPTVILATPNPIPALRLVASPDLVAGETIEWGNVVGGLDGDVTVTPDATWTAATGVASFDWRVFDGAWGEWATQNITASGVTLNQNQYFLSGGIQGEGLQRQFPGLQTSTSCLGEFSRGSFRGLVPGRVEPVQFHFIRWNHGPGPSRRSQWNFDAGAPFRGILPNVCRV